MKRIVCPLIMLSFLTCLTACQQANRIKKDLEIQEMRAITELATVQCYFHNVAKSDEPTNKAWYEFWEKSNIRFWVEYDGVVTIGIDASKLEMQVENTTVRITVPEAIVLDAIVNPKSLTKESYYYDPNTKKPDENDEQKAFEEAQLNMIDAAKSNAALLLNAQENAKELLENYVNTIGEALGIEYTIEWVVVDNTSIPKGSD